MYCVARCCDGRFFLIVGDLVNDENRFAIELHFYHVLFSRLDFLVDAFQGCVRVCRWIPMGLQSEGWMRGEEWPEITVGLISSTQLMLHNAKPVMIDWQLAIEAFDRFWKSINFGESHRMQTIIDVPIGSHHSQMVCHPYDRRCSISEFYVNAASQLRFISLSSIRYVNGFIAWCPWNVDTWNDLNTNAFRLALNSTCIFYCDHMCRLRNHYENRIAFNKPREKKCEFWFFNQVWFFSNRDMGWDRLIWPKSNVNVVVNEILSLLRANRALWIIQMRRFCWNRWLNCLGISPKAIKIYRKSNRWARFWIGNTLWPLRRS